jgi:MarR family multiple antibiotic resistance transcriptional regulator
MSMDFFDVLVRYEIALWNAVDQELARQELISLAHLHALRVVDRYQGRARVQEVSDDIGITVGAASKLVDRLERAGLAVRRPNPDNRRSSLVALTADGQQAFADALQVCRSTVARLLGDEDVEALTAALRRLQSRVDAQPVGTAA